MRHRGYFPIGRLSRNTSRDHFEIAVVYAEPDGRTFEYVFSIPIYFSQKIKGNPPARDNALMIDRESRTFSEYPHEERIKFWVDGFEAVAEYVVNKNIDRTG